MENNEKSLTRRDFIKAGGLATAGLAIYAMPSWLRAAAGSATSRDKTLVVLFQRGAADGLNIVVPFADPLYQAARPTIGLKEPGRDAGVLDLDGKFGLHPTLAPLMPLWQGGQMALVHAAGSPDGSRSHFDAQDNMETGTPGISTTPDGWLNRALATQGKNSDPLTAVALTARLPRILRGDYPVSAMTSAGGYNFSMGAQESDTIASLYRGNADSLLANAGQETSESVKLVKSLLKNAPNPLASANYSQSDLGHRFSDLAKLIKAGAGVKVGFLDVGGWDNHYEEGSIQGYLSYALKDYGQNIAAFFTDLGDKARDVVLVTMTEFGRTLNENGARGTDHGHGSVMFVIGGSVKGGKVYGRWPGLEPENLYEGRDLQVTTDFRQVHLEVLQKHLKITHHSSVFPGFNPETNLGFL
jgi:uncharacterized protein (DUF1501 family)